MRRKGHRAGPPPRETADSASPAAVEEAARKRLWLFDFDETLALMRPLVDWRASRGELEEFLRGVGAPEDLFARFPSGNLPLYDAFRSRILAGSRDDGDARALLRRASEIIERHELRAVDRAEPMPGAVELLRSLKSRGKTVAVVTSNSSRAVTRWIELNRLSESITLIVGRDSLMALKPSPDMLLHAFNILRVPPRDAVFVGDSEADVHAATAAGVAFYPVCAARERRERMIAAGVSEIASSPAALGLRLKLLDINVHNSTNPAGHEARSRLGSR